MNRFQVIVCGWDVRLMWRRADRVIHPLKRPDADIEVLGEIDPRGDARFLPVKMFLQRLHHRLSGETSLVIVLDDMWNNQATVLGIDTAAEISRGLAEMVAKARALEEGADASPDR